MKLAIKNISKLLLCGVLIAISGCSDFLNEEDPSNIAPETFFTTPDDAEAAVYGIYENLRFHGDGTGIFSANFQMLDALSGTAETETGQNSDLNNLYGFTHTGDNLHLQQWWRQLYDGIANANLAIEKIPGIPGISEANAAKWVGHAKFLRAFHYFWLVRLWGDVPLITQPIFSWKDPNINAPRTAQADVYALIESDLLAAEAAGFPMTDVSGLASLASVKALLAQVYLTMAGNPLNRGAEYYQKAAVKAKEVIDYAKTSAPPSRIGLFPTYEDIHNPLNENSSEHLFMIQYASGIANANYQTYFLPNNTNITASGEVGTTVPTANFLASYEAGDLRKQEKGFFFREYFRDGGTGTPITLNRLYVYKHFDTPANGRPGAPGTGNSGLNYPLIRYAEVLLIYAEAQNEIGGGPNTDAYNALVAIRSRAGLTTPDIGTLTQTTFRELVWRERWHELCYEGITWFDMVRLRKVYQYNEATNTHAFIDFAGASLNGATLQTKHLLLPLPAADFRNNPNMKPNNPGWD